MSMSTHVTGFRPADEKWNRMKAVWNTCKEAKVPIPDEVKAFFEGEAPDDKPGAEVSIKEAATEWNDGHSRGGYEIDISKLPPDVEILRFYNAY